MKVVINKCYGGFGLSAKAVARLAELKGRPAYFFVRDTRKGGLHAPFEPVTAEQADRRNHLTFFAFDVPNPDEVLPSQENWHEMTMDERRSSNEVHERHSLDTRPSPRNDPDLVRVVEELGDAANGMCAELSIVEIPDDVEFQIEEYDGREWVAEIHRTWA